MYLHDDFAVSQPHCGGQFEVSAENPPVPLTWDYSNNQDCFWTFNLAPARTSVVFVRPLIPVLMISSLGVKARADPSQHYGKNQEVQLFVWTPPDGSEIKADIFN